MAFTIFPAIDLRGGKVVRLRRGDPGAQTVFGDDPAEMARRWAGAGATWLHVVNLDGALAQPGESGGAALNLRRLAEIRAATGLPIQFGGGVRSQAAIAQALELGAERVVLGTAAVQDPNLVGEAVARFGAERVVVGLDARDGKVATEGWQATSSALATDLGRSMRELGVLRAVYTDIGRDGMLAGSDVEGTLALARATGLRIIASGGVATLADLRSLASHAAAGIEGAIIGQALYTGAVILKEAIREIRRLETSCPKGIGD